MIYAKNNVDGKGFYLHYPVGFDRRDVEPPASGWFEQRKDAEAEMLRLAKLTNKGFMVVKVVSKCMPWMYPNNFTSTTPKEAP